MASTNDSKSFCRGSNPLVPASLIGASPSGKAADSDSAYQWFESTSPCHYGHVAEWLKANCICSCVETDWKSVHPPGVRILSCPTYLLPQHNGECSCFVSSWLQVQVLQVAPLRPFSSLGQSRRLIIVWYQVQILEGPPIRILSSAGRAVDF